MPKKIASYTNLGFKKDPNSAIFRDIDERLNELEDRVFKTARKSDTTVKQQILILHHLGLLDKINELKISGVKKAKLLSVLLNGSADNISDHLSQVNRKESTLKTKNNYEFLIKTFEAAGLKKHADLADIILLDILKKTEK